LKTDNAGQSWDTLHLPLYENENDGYVDVFFIDPMTGWFGGAFGTLFHTRDGGESWDKQEGATNNWLQKVFFIDHNRGWAVGLGGSVSRTTDGGENWESDNIGDNTFQDIYFTDSLHGWAVGDEGRIISSVDGGNNWTPILNSPPTKR